METCQSPQTNEIHHHMSEGWLQSIRGVFQPSDEQAMWRVQHFSDHDAFALLVERWQPPIQRLCIRMTGDTQRGEDLAQETFLRLFAHRSQYRAESKFSSYLWRIALNLCHDENRRRIRRSEIPLDGEDPVHGSISDTLETGEPAADAILERNEQAGQVAQALAKLPEHYRAVLVLKHYHDLKFREIAEALEIPEGTVKSRLVEGLRLLSKALLIRKAGPGISTPISTPARESLFVL